MTTFGPVESGVEARKEIIAGKFLQGMLSLIACQADSVSLKLRMKSTCFIRESLQLPVACEWHPATVR
jgi:hypothetical protein